MSSSRRSFLMLGLLVCAVSITCFAPRALAAGLEGKWKVKIEPDDDARKAGEKQLDDTLVFTPTKFTSEAMKKRGYGEADYEENVVRFGPSTFTILQKSEKEGGKLKWTGTETSGEITGDIVMTRKDGSELRFTYKGSRAPGK